MRAAGRTAFRGCEPPQSCQPQHDRPSRGSDKPARAATIFIHSGAPQARVGYLGHATRLRLCAYGALQFEQEAIVAE